MGGARIEALAAAARRRGADGGMEALCADAYLGLVDRHFAGLTDDDVVAALVAAHRGGAGDGRAELPEPRATSGRRSPPLRSRP